MLQKRNCYICKYEVPPTYNSFFLATQQDKTQTFYSIVSFLLLKFSHKLLTTPVLRKMIWATNYSKSTPAISISLKFFKDRLACTRVYEIFLHPTNINFLWDLDVQLSSERSADVACLYIDVVDKAKRLYKTC